MANKKANPCEHLERVLSMYEKTPWDLISRYITYLTGTGVVLIFLGVGALATPRRLAPRVLLGAILFAQVLVLAPYFILDMRRSSMTLQRSGIENEVKLNNNVTECNKGGKYKIILNPAMKYRYRADNMWWEGLTMIACTCIAGMLTSRIIYLSVARRTDDYEPTSNRLLINLPQAPLSSRTNRDINAFLASVRAPSGEREQFRDKQCAICLEDFGDGDVSLLDCSHPYHEACLGSWLRSSTAKGKCPMCKVSVWRDNPVDMELEQV